MQYISKKTAYGKRRMPSHLNYAFYYKTLFIIYLKLFGEVSFKRADVGLPV